MVASVHAFDRFRVKNPLLAGFTKPDLKSNFSRRIFCFKFFEGMLNLKSFYRIYTSMKHGSISFLFK
ncbi:MAG: hypothetical protein A2X77_02960 [Gammaproteobacteria bacterium GWE2_42_36]|nr:MAG: hypothetical protein A2X77_02960 [Gammaproteobacteria bacterium GWE2_42_36]HCU04923.1 hypothetical protein [Coxiellaceae bacterium]